jgi:hypothetical protein
MNKEQFIEVRKLIEVPKKDAQGNNLVNPISHKPIINNYNALKEMIEVASIKSARPWEKNSEQVALIDGDITLIYLKGGDANKPPIQILIAEPYDSFVSRCPTIRLIED